METRRSAAVAGHILGQSDSGKAASVTVLIRRMASSRNSRLNVAAAQHSLGLLLDMSWHRDMPSDRDTCSKSLEPTMHVEPSYSAASLAMQTVHSGQGEPM